MKILQKTFSGLLILTLFVPNIALFAQVSDLSSESSPSSPLEPAKNKDTSVSQTNNDSGISVVEESSRVENAVVPEIIETISQEGVEDSVDSGNEETESVTSSQITNDVLKQINRLSYEGGKSNVDIFSGAFNYSYPIPTPKGRSGLGFDLSLNYSNQTDLQNILGHGWSLNIPSIERMNKYGVNNLYTSNTFTSSLSGELATTTNTNQYVTRLENGSSIQYQFSNNIWTAKTKEGMTYAFGQTEQSRLFDTASSSRVAKWFLSEIRDANDNFVRFEYAKDGGQAYPSAIYYTGQKYNSNIKNVSSYYNSGSIKNPHGQRYGDRVNSYVNNGTHKSNSQKVSEFIKGLFK